MTKEHPLRDDTDRLVLLNSTPTKSYQKKLEGHEQNSFETQIKKFLNGVTPESSLEDKRKFRSPLRQLKDRGSKIRALGVWCQGDDYDLFIIQIMYFKTDNDDELGQNNRVGRALPGLQSRAEDHKDRFNNRNVSHIRQKREEWKQEGNLRVFIPSDFTG